MSGNGMQKAEELFPGREKLNEISGNGMQKAEDNSPEGINLNNRGCKPTDQRCTTNHNPGGVELHPHYSIATLWQNRGHELT
jgi:hypothetical protein